MTLSLANNLRYKKNRHFFLEMKKLLAILKNPYNSQNNIEEYQAPAPLSNEKYQTFCGT